ncbi:uncharacterized protein LOC135823917 [Sycon ciliatum]|uniref:uncharacterized protein LOC135823917 n=1 Tax=Sycon ciliatum TaxID=27933 RepID=UPI0031F6815B
MARQRGSPLALLILSFLVACTVEGAPGVTTPTLNVQLSQNQVVATPAAKNQGQAVTKPANPGKSTVAVKATGAVGNPKSTNESTLTTAAIANVVSTVPGPVVTESHYYRVPLSLKHGAMVLIIVAGVIGFFYIVLSSWRSSRRRNRLRSFRGAREKQEMEPLGKNADDQEDETIFDMSRA